MPRQHPRFKTISTADDENFGWTNVQPAQQFDNGERLSFSDIGEVGFRHRSSFPLTARDDALGGAVRASPRFGAAATKAASRRPPNYEMTQIARHGPIATS
jgi:hypothetical protein